MTGKLGISDACLRVTGMLGLSLVNADIKVSFCPMPACTQNVCVTANHCDTLYYKHHVCVRLHALWIVAVDCATYVPNQTQPGCASPKDDSDKQHYPLNCLWATPEWLQGVVS